ncbi:hypothetical protein [Moraxella lacunata]|uniref:hypothetical protein n=1 Tax=Moraxella lacunata TaxID=477 RepID=UPI000B080D4C
MVLSAKSDELPYISRHEHHEYYIERYFKFLNAKNHTVRLSLKIRSLNTALNQCRLYHTVSACQATMQKPSGLNTSLFLLLQIIKNL